MGITRTLRVASGAVLTGALVFTSAPHAAADQVRDAQWALKSLDANSAWETTKGEGETVAVIDDGVNAQHPDLKGNVLQGKDFIDGGAPGPKEGDDHGTGIASVIAGHGHGADGADGMMGLAPKAEILPVRDQGHGPEGYAKSIRYAVDQGAYVINISQGQATPRSSAEEDAAVTYALKHDVVIMAATGNGEGEVGYPASYPGVVAVGAVTANGEAWEDSDPGPEIKLNAPGSKIPHAGSPKDPNGYGMATGTSYATAYASAGAALLKAKYPDHSAGQIVNRLTETAELPSSKKGASLPDEQYGYGTIRPLAALQEDIPKGSKYGPLSVPKTLKDDAEVAAKEKESDAQQTESDKQAVILWAITGVIGLVFIAIVTLVIVKVRRRKNRNNGPGGPGGPGVPGEYSYPPDQTPGYGMPPHQQQPMPPQPASPHQQPPHN